MSHEHKLIFCLFIIGLFGILMLYQPTEPNECVDALFAKSVSNETHGYKYGVWWDFCQCLPNNLKLVEFLHNEVEIQMYRQSYF